MDCNNCKYLNVTETEQIFIKQRGNTHVPHICTKYNKRVLHMAANRNHSGYLYPCDECIKENNNEII